MEVLLGAIIPANTTEWLGKSCATVFFGGCNFRCGYCWSHKILDDINCQKTDSKKVFDYVMAEKGLFDAVAFDGGEPTLQPEALMELCKMFKKEGILIKLNTNGSNAGAIGELAERGLVDYVALDIKAPLAFEREYHKNINAAPKKILDQLFEIFHFRHAFDFFLECRTTVVPGLMFRPHDIEEIAKEVSKTADLYVLQQFTPERGCVDASYEKLQEVPKSELLKLARAAKKYIKNVHIRTTDGEEIV